MTSAYTVVVPTRGDPAALRRIADNIAAPDTDLLVVVNGSGAVEPEAWATAVRRCRSARRVHCPGGGVSRARNLALRITGTDDLVFVDDDVIPPASSLDKLVRALDDLDVAVTTGRVCPIPAEESELYELFIGLDRGTEPRIFGPESLAEFNPTTSWALGAGAAFAVRRSALDGLDAPPQFDESLSNGRPCGGAEDVDFFLLCLRAGARLAYCPDAEFPHAFPRTRPAASAKLRQYARADGAFYAKWRSDLTVGDAGADLADWAGRFRRHVRNRRTGEPYLPVLALAQEPLQKTAGALWWRLFASR